MNLSQLQLHQQQVLSALDCRLQGAHPTSRVSLSCIQGVHAADGMAATKSHPQQQQPSKQDYHGRPTQGTSLDECLAAVRLIKNSIIGNRTNKLYFMHLGVIPKLVQLLAEQPHDSLSSALDPIRTQAAIALGSFAYGGDENIETLVQAGAIPPLLRVMSPTTATSAPRPVLDPPAVLLANPTRCKLIVACARALKTIFHNAAVPRDAVFQGHYDKVLVQLLQCVPQSVPGADHESASHLAALPELGAVILARCCETKAQQMSFAAHGCVPLLLDCLQSSRPRTQEAALDAVAALCRDNSALAMSFLSSAGSRTTQAGSLMEQEPLASQTSSSLTGPATVPASASSFMRLLLMHLRDKRPSMRLIAATCYTNLYRSGVLTDPGHDIRTYLLPTLVKLFAESEPYLQEKSPLVLAYLVSESEDMQKAAADTDSISKLAAVLTTVSDRQQQLAKKSTCNPSTQLESATSEGSASDRLFESVLLALAAVSSLKEECRQLVIETKVLPHILYALEHKSVNVRSAACQCTRSLSRSVKNLRTSLVDAGVALPLVKLLSDESTTVQATASATLCNIVLDFSPMKKTILESGGVKQLTALVSSMDSNLRLNAVWALKNLLFQADSDVKLNVMTTLTYPVVEALLNDSEMGIQEQAVNLLRNLACGKEADIEAVFQGLGEDKLMACLENKLNSSSEDIVIQALYVIVNVSTGSETHKGAIMSNPAILNHILSFMNHSLPKVRTATIWCVINLTWQEDPGSEGRVRQLRGLGFEDRLKVLNETDNDNEVHDRIRTALQHFQQTALIVVGGSGGSAAADISSQVD